MAKKWKSYPWQVRTTEGATDNGSVGGSTFSTFDDKDSKDSSNCESEFMFGKLRKRALVRQIAKVSADSANCESERCWTTTPTATTTVAAPSNGAEEEEEIDVVGDAAANISAPTGAATASAATATPTCWGPSSPTAGTTAPSPQPQFTPEEATRDSTLYNGRFLCVVVVRFGFSTFAIRPKSQLV